MKTLRNKISILIHQAILKKKLPKLEEKQFTDVLSYYIKNNTERDSVTEEHVIELLNSEVIKRQDSENKLNNPNSLNSFGDYLKLFIEKNSIDKEVLCQSCRIEATFFSQLLDNKIKVLDFGPKKIAQLVKYLNLRIEIVKELLVKTIWLNSHSFSIQETLARYDPKKGRDKKDSSMSSGIKELLFKANMSKPLFQKNPDIDNVIQNYLSEFEKYYNKL